MIILELTGEFHCGLLDPHKAVDVVYVVEDVSIQMWQISMLAEAT